jgi:glyoxylase-like metal-dependent hydrolase (beta-lactamase superfamily II)
VCVHVERFESALWQTSSLLLVADAEAVAVDPCISAVEVATIAAHADALGARVTHVLATHGDWDHVCGIAAFPGAVATMGPLTAEIVASGAAAATIAKRAVEYGIDVAGPPRVDRVLEPGLAHRVGPFVVETKALAGHTPDGVAYRFREAGVLAVGDHLSAAEFPFASSTADYRATLATLIETLRHDPPERVVPGHGPELTASEALAIGEADLAYLRALRDAVLRGDDPQVVPLPRPAPDELAEMRAANVQAQLRELSPGE